MAVSYQIDPRTGAMVRRDDTRDGAWDRPPVFPSGGGGPGLITTADDYLAFCRMLLNRGRYDGGPAEDLVGVLLTQRAMSSPQHPRVFRDFWTTAYAAIDD